MPNVAADWMQGCTDHTTMDRKCMSLFLIFEAFKEIIIFISGFLVLNYDDSFEFVCRLECTCFGNYLGHSEHFQFFTLLSSPEHNVLRMSYCDRSLPGVCPSGWPSGCPSVNNYLKNLLL